MSLDVFADLERLSLAVEAEQEQINILQRSHSELRDEVLALRARIPPAAVGGSCKSPTSLKQHVAWVQKSVSQHSSPAPIRSPSVEPIAKCITSSGAVMGGSSIPLSERLAAVVAPTVARQNTPARTLSGKAAVLGGAQDPGAPRASDLAPHCFDPPAPEFNASSRFEEVWHAWDIAALCVRSAGLLTALCLRSVSSAMRASMNELTCAFAIWFPHRVYALGGSQGLPSKAAPTVTAERFDTGSGSWEEICPMVHARRHAAAVAAGSFIYVIGGHDGRAVLDKVERYDPASDSWQPLPQLQGPRFGAAAAVLTGRGIYVVGGHNGKNAISSCERFDHGLGSTAGTTSDADRNLAWQSAPALCTPRVLAKGIVLDKRLFVIGGTDTGERFHASAEWLEPDAAKWTEEDMPRQITPRLAASLSSSTCGNALISAGGYADNDRNLKATALVECFVRGAWSPLPALKQSRMSAASTVANGDVYVLGGRGADGALASVECWNCTDGHSSWKKIADMRVARDAAVAIASRF